MWRTLDSINLSAENPAEFINRCTEEYHSEIHAVADKIINDKNIKIVAIAGPSASGKTTTAHLLMDDLKKHYDAVSVISLDDFYLEKDKQPILPDGSSDTESVNSLDIPLLKKCFENLINTGKSYIPKFDFNTGKRNDKDRLVETGENGILIVEGLHALNPVISELVPKKYIYKIFICIDKSVEDNDGQQILSARQIRLIRRVIRDKKFRSCDIKTTLFKWNSVLEGEMNYMFPYKDTADSKIRTMHPFEICVYKEEFCRLRSGVDRSTPWYEFFLNTANGMEQVKPIDASYVPSDSLIKEFIG